MNIGERLKEIRLERKLSQKEMCGDVLTASYYSKIEKNRHRISAEDLLKILDLHQINPHLFLEKIQTRPNPLQEITEIQHQTAVAFYEKNPHQIEQLLTKLSFINLPARNKAFIHAQLKSILSLLKKDPSIVTDEERQLLREFIHTKGDWNNETLTLFANTMAHSSVLELAFPVQTILQKHHKNKAIDVFRLKILSVIAVNFVDLAIKENQDHLAHQPLQWLLERSVTPDTIFYKILSQYYSDLLHYRKEEEEKSQSHAFYLIQMLRDLGMEAYSQELAVFWEKNRRKV